MRLYSYVVRRDFGFAPNPFFRVCTLATCKPVIRRVAAIGDWVMGTGSKTNGREKNIVYAMRITGTVTFEEYWADPRFQHKKPDLRGSKKRAYGDNIYYRNPNTGHWSQLNSHHTFHDGSPNPANIKTDTGTNRILFSDDFVYFGGSGPQIPQRFRSWGSQLENVCAVHGHKSRFPAKMVEEVVNWIRSLNEPGYRGEPLDWRATS